MCTLHVYAYGPAGQGSGARGDVRPLAHRPHRPRRGVRDEHDFEAKSTQL